MKMAQNNMQSPQQLFETLMQANLSQMDFRDLTMEEQFLLEKAARFCSMSKIGCHLHTWTNIGNGERKFRVAELIFITNILGYATPQELEQTVSENVQMIEKIIVPINAEYNAIIEELGPKIRREVEAKIKISQLAPPNKKDIRFN